MAKSIIVIGLGRFGTSIAHTLYQMGYDVLGIDTDEKVVQDNLGHITYSVQGDATNETTLRELGVSNFDAAVVAVGSDMQSSLMSSVLLTTLDVPLIVGRAENQLHGNTLQRVGVHKIIYPEQESGELIARSLFLDLAHSFLAKRIFACSKFWAVFLASVLAPKPKIRKTINRQATVLGRRESNLSLRVSGVSFLSVAMIWASGIFLNHVSCRLA